MGKEKNKEMRPIAIMAVLLIVGISTLLNENLMNVAFPILAADFQVPISLIQWMTTGFMLIMGIFVPITAYLLRKFPMRKIFFTAIALFLIGTLIAALANHFPQLLTGRLVQAVGTALFVPMIINTVLHIAPREKLGFYNGLVMLVLMTAPAIGPTLSGYILGALGWRWLFWISLPLPIVAACFAYFVLPNIVELTNPKLDILSVFLTVIGFGGVVFGLGSAGTYGFFSPWVLVPLALGVIGLFFYARRQLHLEDPLLDLRILANRKYRLGYLFIIINFANIFGFVFLMPLYMQEVLGLEVVTVGLLLLPGGLINGMLSPVAGKIYDRFGMKSVPIGIFLLIVSLSLFAFVMDKEPASLVLMGIVILFNLGCPFVMSPSQTYSLMSLKPAEYPHGTALTSTSQQVFGAVGTAAYVTILYSVQRFSLAQGMGAATAFIHGGRSALILSIVVLFLLFIAAVTVNRKMHKEREAAS